MVHVLPHEDFGQKKCGKPPTRYVSPDGGSDPVASEPTDGPIRTQWIRNPVWSGLTHGRGVAGLYEKRKKRRRRRRRKWKESKRKRKIIHRWNFMTYIVKLY